jgi:murein L,D-transpeptidase YcbB/YkuD
MTSIVFHPQWVVPVTIVKEDLQPPLRGGGFFGLPDTSILRKHDLAVSLKGKPVDADRVDWKNENIHKYTFTQPPGPKNVLGALKFNFPNKHAIYMHDTPQPELFAEKTRTLSHGCIRVKDPNRLAALLLAEDKGWSSKQVDNKIASRQSSGVELARAIPVHLTYFTAVVDETGRIETFPDIYGLDGRIASTIFGKRIVFAGLAENVTPPRPRAGQRTVGFRQTGGLADGIQGLFGN